MAKVVSQETFDDVVKENIVDFSMSPGEAKEETVKQFEAQGISLANIIKDLAINDVTGRPVLNETIELVKGHLSGEKKLEVSELLANLDIIKEECGKSLPHRVLAAKLGASEILINLLEQELAATNPNRHVILSLLHAANSLINKQPDIFDAEALAVIIKILKNVKENEFLSSALQWLAKACILHEGNRQNIMEAEIINYLKPLFSIKDPKLIRDLCAVYRGLVLDDDIRVEFGKAHEHARILASESLIDITSLLSEYEDANVLSDVMLTIAALCVRQEFCLSVQEAGGLKNLFKALAKCPESMKVKREALKLIKALSGHDVVRKEIVQEGAAPIIELYLNNHKENESLASVALACISSLTLRSKDNSIAFFEAGVAETIVETMRIHPKNKIIQRNAAWAIRNMVSRCRNESDRFLSQGVEDLLNTAMVDHPTIHYDIKAALRDLDCKVELKEEWTGTAEKKILN